MPDKLTEGDKERRIRGELNTYEQNLVVGAEQLGRYIIGAAVIIAIAILLAGC